MFTMPIYNHRFTMSFPVCNIGVFNSKNIEKVIFFEVCESIISRLWVRGWDAKVIDMYF